MADEDVYETINITEMTFNDAEQSYEYDCICGDKFRAPVAELKTQHESDKYKGYYLSTCPTCFLKIKIILDDSFWATVK